MPASLIIALVGVLLNEAPEAIIKIRALFNKTEITEEDWKEFKASLTRKKYHDYVPDSDLPKP